MILLARAGQSHDPFSNSLAELKCLASAVNTQHYLSPLAELRGSCVRQAIIFRPRGRLIRCVIYGLPFLTSVQTWNHPGGLLMLKLWSAYGGVFCVCVVAHWELSVLSFSDCSLEMTAGLRSPVPGTQRKYIVLQSKAFKEKDKKFYKASNVWWLRASGLTIKQSYKDEGVLRLYEAHKKQ